MSENNIKTEKKTSAVGYVFGAVFLVLLTIMYLGLVAFFIFMYNSALYLEDMVETASLMAYKTDEKLDHISSIRNSYFGVIQNELQIAGLMYDRGAFENDDRVLDRVFGNIEFYIFDRDGNQISTRSDLVGDPEEIRELIRLCDEMETARFISSDGSLLYAKKLSDGNVVVRQLDPESVEEFQKNVGRIDDLILANTTGYSAVLVSRDGYLTNAPDFFADVIGSEVEEFLKPVSDKTDIPGKPGTMSYRVEIEGREYAVVEAPSEDDHIVVHYLVESSHLFRLSGTIILVIVTITVFGLAVILYFLRQFRKAHPDADRRTERELNLKSGILSLTAVCIVAVTSFYAYSLFRLKNYVVDDPYELQIIKDQYEDNKTTADEMKRMFTAMYTEQTEILGNYLSVFPEERTEENLRTWSESFGIQYMIIFDRDGREVISDADYINLVLSEKKDVPSSKFRALLNGTHTLAADIETDDLTGLYHQLIGVSLRGEDNLSEGILMTAYESDIIQNAVEAYSIESVLKAEPFSGQNYYFLIDPETKKIEFSTMLRADGVLAEDFGFTGKVMTDGFAGKAVIDGENCHATQTNLEGKYLYIALPYSIIYKNRMPFTVSIAAGAALFYAVAGLIMRMLGGHGDAAGSSGAPDAFISRVFRDGSLGTDLYAEERTTKLIAHLIHLVQLAFFILIVFRQKITAGGSMVDYIVGGTWENSVNFFSVTAVLIMILVVSICVQVVRHVLNIFARIVSRKAQTYILLLKSAVEYLSVLIVGYIALAMFGIDMAKMLAATSIMVMIVGMGAQDMTQDIISGLFLMFESEFQVGDVIEVSGQRGRVKEIGLHSTKLIDQNNNILLMNNSKVKNIINLTQNSNYTVCRFTISSGVSISDLEKIFAAELPALKEQYPQFESAPYFQGVKNFKDGKMECCVAAEASEANRTESVRILNSEIQKILMRNGITIG